jgi:hypothetical protein
MSDKHPLAEVFGFPITNNSDKAERYRKNKLCPFHNKVPSCTKNSATDPLGVCSIFHNGDKVITCPIRFTEDWIISEQCAEFFFDEETIEAGRWTSLREVRLKDANGSSAGNIDYVLVSYDETGNITDFGSIEVQAVYISGNVTNPFKHYMGKRKEITEFDWSGEAKYPRPDYLSSSRKRLAPQLLYKGGILKSWNKKQAVVLQDTFSDTLPKLPIVDNKHDADVAWFVYSLSDNTDQFNLELKETIYTSFEDALNKITVPEAGNIKDFLNVLQEKLDQKFDDPSPDAPTLGDIISQ